MSRLIRASLIADTARQVLARGVPYRNYGQSLYGMDSAGFIYYCFSRHGIIVPYVGTNTLYRAIGGTRIPLRDAIAQGKLVPGSLLFRVNPSGKEPLKFRKDGLGDADFAQICVDPTHAIYASPSKKAVVLDDIYIASGRANMVVFHPGLDYGNMNNPQLPQPPEKPPVATIGQMQVFNTRQLKLRHTPDMSSEENVYTGLPRGHVVTVLQIENGWAQIKANKNGRQYAGWVVADYLKKA